MIKIEKKIMIDFLKKVKMEGNQEIIECVWNFKPEGLSIEAVSSAKQSKVKGVLKRSAFMEYQEFGSIGVDKFSIIINVFNRFEKDISIDVNGNILNVKDGNKRVEIELVDVNYIDKPTESKEFDFKEKFVITAKKLSDVISDVKINKDTKIIIMTKEGHVMFTNTGKYKFEHKIVADTKTEQRSDFGDAFIECVANLDGELEINMSTDFPCKISEKTEYSDIEIVVAPIVEEKE